MNNKDIQEIDSLLEQLRTRFVQTSKAASLASRSAGTSPIDEAGQRIRLERKRQGLTQEDLCELSGVAYATLSKIEQGNRGVRLDNLIKVAGALGMKLWIG